MVRSLGITLDGAAESPLYNQVVEQLARRVNEGVLPPGYRLPATRALAIELGVHRNTIVRAYEELADVGLVISAVGRGTFVADAPSPATATADVDRTLPWRSLVSRAANAEPLRRAERLASSVRSGTPINLNRMQPPMELLPHEQLRKCMDHVLRHYGARALGYAPREGVPRLRALIASELARAGVPATEDAVVITTGSQQALDVIARTLIDPGDVFLVDEATYTGAINVLTAAGARLVCVPSDRQGPDPEALRRLTTSGAKGFYLMPNCGNPTGRRITFERRRELVRWSQQAGVPLIEDDYGADLSLTDELPPPALRALDGQVIYVGTFSKKLIPALRVGFMVCPAGLRRHMLPIKQAMDLGTSALLQLTLAEFIERGYLKRHLERIRPVYRARFQALAGALDEHLPAEVTWEAPSSGVVMWLTLPERLDAERAFDAAQRRGVLVTPGTVNSADGRGRGGLRLVFCCEPPERLVEGARQLGAALDELLSASTETGSTPPNDRERSTTLDMV